MKCTFIYNDLVDVLLIELRSFSKMFYTSHVESDRRNLNMH